MKVYFGLFGLFGLFGFDANNTKLSPSLKAAVLGKKAIAKLQSQVQR
ncbi:hypothetical protein N8446_02790 [Planktomarina temperata]|nr:hypothetical protein [Planktomarina temperata]